MTLTFLRDTPTALLLAAVAITLLPAAASAKMDCHAAYEAAKTSINTKKISADHREAGFRIAHHAYDLCTIGDEDQALRFFEKIQLYGN